MPGSRVRQVRRNDLKDLFRRLQIAQSVQAE